jgi:hypothetical protein
MLLLQTQWTPSTSLPTEASKGKLLAAKAWMDTYTEPAGDDAWTAASDRLTLFSHAFNIRLETLAKALKLYRLALSHLPPDLLMRAVRAAIGAWKWHNSMPTPAELEAPVKQEYAARLIGKSRLGMALTQADRDAAAKDVARKKAVDDAWWADAAKRQGTTVEALKAEAQGPSTARRWGQFCGGKGGPRSGYPEPRGERCSDRKRGTVRACG